tara:strand:- start:7525 stop:8451 length:927 start_codon:yes stop_codon:yes gene_type:complete
MKKSFINNSEDILLEIREKGWTLVENYFDKKSCDEVRKSLHDNLSINSNAQLSTIYKGTKFNTSVLSISKEAFDAVTNKDLRKFAEIFVRDKPILKCVRSYSISKNYPLFFWHSDNVDPETLKADDSIGMNGIIYLEDDYEGSFKIADQKFHDDERKTAVPTYLELENWMKNGSIIPIKAKKGDLILFNQQIYHRHTLKNKSKLDALWFQIVGNKNSKNEKMIIDPSFLSYDESLLRFLGVGKVNIGFNNPRTGISDLTLKNIVQLSFLTLRQIPKSLIKYSYTSIYNKFFRDSKFGEFLVKNLKKNS